MSANGEKSIFGYGYNFIFDFDRDGAGEKIRDGTEDETEDWNVRERLWPGRECKAPLAADKRTKTHTPPLARGRRMVFVDKRDKRKGSAACFRAETDFWRPPDGKGKDTPL